MRSEGADGIARRLRVRAAAALAPDGSEPLPVTRDDLMRAAQIAADGTRPPGPLPVHDAEPLTIAWVCAAPGPGSGGHTTMFRMVAALERAGHRCVVYLDDRHGWELAQHRRAISSWWPWLGAEIRDLSGGIADAHAIIATGWDSAYSTLASPARGVRCYFVQDFEPAFHPAGAMSLLAEETYRFGFHGITAGAWLAERLRRDYGMDAEHFHFGVDAAYRLDPMVDGELERTRVCCYWRPTTPRRATELAIAALELFAERHPAIDIHLYGQTAGPLPFRVVDHGLLTPAELGALYNRCVAGLSLSATNVSLVPHEMLAAGCIAVVNDAEQTRQVLDNEHVVYARPTPFALAQALGALVEQPPAERDRRASDAAASVMGQTWDAAGDEVVRIVCDAVLRGQPSAKCTTPPNVPA